MTFRPYKNGNYNFKSLKTNLPDVEHVCPCSDSSKGLNIWKKPGTFVNAKEIGKLPAVLLLNFTDRVVRIQQYKIKQQVTTGSKIYLNL